MSTHFVFNASLPSGGRLRSALSKLEDGRDDLTKEQLTMTAALDGDGSSDAHFANVVAEYGFTNTTTAHDAWNEINSCLGKLNTDGTVDHVQAAMNQLFTKLR